MESRQSYTVLAVDDNIVNLKLIEKSLSREGYRVICVTSGPKARNAAAIHQPDLILLDIQMPGEDGFSTIRFLKESSLTSTIPVIFLTGVSKVDAKLKGFDLGAVDYITKPFHPKEVLARVGIHLKLSIATNSLILTQAEKLKQLTEAQTALLPNPDDLPEARFGVYYKALHEAGGDFYDILKISSDIMGYFVADFSGHDIMTSYMTSSVKALLAQNCTPVYTPMESMKIVNDVLVEILPAGKYLTACYLKLNRNTGIMTLINAGHPSVAFVPKDGDPELIHIQGDILGMFKDAQFGIHRFNVDVGDRFYIYSDGLVESTTRKVPWTTGAQELLPLFQRVQNLPVVDAPGQLVRSLFGKEGSREDDIVLLCVEV